MAVPNFPTKPGFGSSGASMTFPKDLNNGSREFCTKISFVEYNSPLGTSAGGSNISMGKTVTLPIPRKLNDNEVVLWEEWSGVGTAELAAQNIPGLNRVASAAVAGMQMAGTFTGETVNPFQFMMFKRPMFKEHSLSWTLAPNSQEESDNLRDIIKECKRAALPPTVTDWMMQYPKLARISFKPSGYLYEFKPCVIVAVQVDYTAAGQPSFFKSGAPTIVNLTLQLKEYQLQSAQDI